MQRLWGGLNQPDVTLGFELTIKAWRKLYLSMCLTARKPTGGIRHDYSGWLTWLWPKKGDPDIASERWQNYRAELTSPFLQPHSRWSFSFASRHSVRIMYYLCRGQLNQKCNRICLMIDYSAPELCRNRVYFIILFHVLRHWNVKSSHDPTEGGWGGWGWVGMGVIL